VFAPNCETACLPTMMRDSLKNTISSISKQDRNIMGPIIVVQALNSTQDGEVVCSDFVREDLRHKCVEYEREAYSNCGGSIRNFYEFCEDALCCICRR